MTTPTNPKTLQQLRERVTAEKYTESYCGESFSDGWNRALEKVLAILDKMEGKQ